MDAFFIGQTYIDVTFLTDHIPVGDEKSVASAYAISFGGNAVTAAFCCAKFGASTHLLATLANDWLGRMFSDMAAKYDICLHARYVKTSSLSFIMPREGKRAIVRCRDVDYLSPAPALDLTGCRVLHVDGHQADAVLSYAKSCREKGILTSLDGGGLRQNTHELLQYIDVAVVSELFCEQLGLTPGATLNYLRGRGCRIGGVTLGERGFIWYDEADTFHANAALPVPRERVIDTNGAGDVFHGAYVHSYLAAPSRSWAEHFRFAESAAAHKIQHLGNEAGLPSRADVLAVEREFGKQPLGLTEADFERRRMPAGAGA
jgi:sugar/nucleoside kinase (ribokinase family)